MTVFVDSSFLIALFNKDDEFHQKARKIAAQIENKNPVFITSNIAVSETVNVIFRTKGAKNASDFYSLLKKAGLKTFNINEDVFNKGLKFLFKQKTKKEFNFFDCLHLSTMQFLKIKNILTFDSDFKKVKVKVLGI